MDIWLKIGGLKMTEMISFSTYILESIASFLGSTPIIYLFGCVCLCFIVKAVKSLFTY